MKKHNGLSLIELLISMFISAIIMVGVVQIYGSSTQNAVITSGSTRMQENIRYAFSRIADDIAQAGNLGCISSSVKENIFTQSTFTNLLDTSGNQYYNFMRLIDGSNDITGDSEVATGTDTFNIRYVSHQLRLDYDSHTSNSITVVSDTDSIEQYQVVMLSNCNRGAIFMVSNEPSASGGLMELRHDIASHPSSNLANSSNDNRLGTVSFANNGQFNITSPAYLYAGDTGVYEYYIGTRSGGTGNCDNDNQSNCSLYRRDNTNRSLEIVEGVHNMQVDYGWTDSSNRLFFKPANTMTANEWQQVDRIRIALEFNSIDNVAQISDSDNINLLTRPIERVFNLPNQL